MSISFLNLSNSPKIRDRDWLSNCFMLSSKNVPTSAYKAMMLSSAHRKFTDTRIGGNIAINMPPAYTRFADPRATGLNVKNIRGTRPAGLGMYWSEQIDDNAQIIHMQFGVPTFRGMLSFFTSVSNVEAGILARTGRVPISFFVGQIVGFVVGLRLLPYILVGKVIKYLLNRQGSKYYNFKPAMHPYWNRVNFIANSFAVSEGIVDRSYGPTSERTLANSVQQNGQNFERNLENNNTAVESSTVAADTRLVRAAHAACPELFLPNGGVDVYRIAMRYQSLANARREFIETLARNNDPDTLISRLIEAMYVKKYDVPKEQNIHELRKIHTTEFAGKEYHDGLDGAMENLAKDEANKALQTAMGGAVTTADQANAGEAIVGENTAAAGSTATAGAASSTEATIDREKAYDTFDTTLVSDPVTGEVKPKEGWFKSWWSGLGNDLKSGYAGAFSWVSFKVNATGPVSASFSNSTSTPEIKSSINGFSSTAAKMRFNFSQGATGIPGIDTLVSGIKNAALGFASGIELMGLVSLAGTSFIDIPDTWEDSSANMPSESYDIHLRTPYGNALSRYMNLYIPLSMLLAGALPISTGRQSYASPFICQLYSVGRSATKLGMIDNLQITHGVGNVGFNRENKPLGIDINLTVKDLNRTVHAPIDTGGMILNPLNALSIFDDDNAFNEYLNVLTAMSVADMTMATRKLNRSIQLKMMQYDSFFSSGHLTLAATESAPGRALRSVGSVAGLVFPSVAPGMNRIQ